MDRLTVSKLEAARRQLDTAIILLFDGCDPLAVHTLVGAASVIVSDLVEKNHPEKSWDKMAQEDNNITSSEYFQVMRAQQNFLKHARDDANETFNFDLAATEYLAFWVVMNLGAFGERSIPQTVFQFWFLAGHPDIIDITIKPYKKALQLFGDLSDHSRATRLSIGKQVLARQQEASNE